VPPIYQAVIDALRARRTDLSSIRICISGAMRLPVDVQERFEALSGARLVEGYGTTEASPATHCNPVSGRRKPGSFGVPLTGTYARIVDPDDPTTVLPPGTAGELVVKGPQVFLGYWGNSVPAEQVFTSDGYLLTGDIAVMDGDGYFRIVDRKKELIIAGGFNVYPSEVEEVITQVAGVREAVVVGVPDRYRGETVKAYVVPEPGATVDATVVRDHCAEVLTAYKVPTLVEIRADLPHNAVGKPLRRLLAEEAASQSGSAAPAAVPVTAAAKKAASATSPAKRPSKKAASPRKAVAAAGDVPDTGRASTAARKRAPKKAPATPVAKKAAPRKKPQDETS
jgi:long-chain acyl-CoA synthetase